MKDRSKSSSLRYGRKNVDLKGKRLLLLGSALAALILLSITLVYFFKGSTISVGVDVNKAAIVDGLTFTEPDSLFVHAAKGILEEAGLSVDIYEGENVTIDLLRSIGGYGLLILRLHSAVDTNFGFLYLFSAEKFNDEEYWSRFGDVIRVDPTAIKEGKTFTDERYFALRADLLGYLSQSGLKGSVIILMGCNGTCSSHAINKLLNERGVRAIIAWDGYVTLEHSDKAILNLIEMVYGDGLGWQDAVERVVDEVGSDPYGSKLRYIAAS